jgi:hypothetical protein
MRKQASRDLYVVEEKPEVLNVLESGASEHGLKPREGRFGLCVIDFFVTS